MARARRCASLLVLALLPCGGPGHAAAAAPAQDAAASAPPPAASLALSLDARAALSDNANTAAAGATQADLIGLLRPRVQYTHHGAGLEIGLKASAALVGTADGSQPASVRPDVDATLAATLLPRWFFIDAGLRLRQAEIDPFGPRVDDGSTSTTNRRTEEGIRLAPRIEHEFGQGLRLLMRQDSGLTHHAAGSDGRLATEATTLRIEQAPRPLGAAADLSRLDSLQRGQSASRLTLETVRLQALAALAASDLRLAAELGQDLRRNALGEHRDPLAGVRADWQPSERSTITAALNRRFFGRGGELEIRHRTPWLSLNLGWRRAPMLASQAGDGAIGAMSTANALDAMLTTRHPQAAERRALVAEATQQAGLDPSSSGPVQSTAAYPQLLDEARLDLAWTTPRTTIGLSAWRRSARALLAPGDPLAAGQVASADNRQDGGSLLGSRRLTPTLSVAVLAQVSRIAGIGLQQGPRSDDRLLRLTFVQAVAPRTTLESGVQRERFTTTAGGAQPHRADQVFVGLSERF